MLGAGSCESALQTRLPITQIPIPNPNPMKDRKAPNPIAVATGDARDGWKSRNPNKHQRA